MKRGMKVLDTVFDVLEQGFGVIFLLIMFVSVLIQIFFRYVLKSPTTWTEEASRYSFIWVVLLGTSFAVRRKEHVVMEVLVSRLPRFFRKYLGIALNIIVLAALLYLLPVSWNIFMFMKNFSSPTLSISWGFLFFAAPLSIALMAVHTFLHLLRGGSEKSPDLAPQ